MTAHDAVELVKALAWPVAALVGMAMLKGPLSDMVRAIGQRATKLSAFKVEIELARLSEAKVPMETAIRGLRSVPILESAIPPDGPVAGGAGFGQLVKAAMADYVEVHLGENGDEWLTSRLFLLVALLERSETLRAIAFTGPRREFVGAAAPRDIRVALGLRFPEYEAALARGHGWSGQLSSAAFRGGLTEEMVAKVASGFMADPDVASQTPATPTGWVCLADETSPDATGSSVAGGSDGGWEFALWVTPEWLRATLGERLDQALVAGGAGGSFPDAVTRDIVRNKGGAFVALAGPSRAFEGLCDRRAIVEAVARKAIEQGG